MYLSELVPQNNFKKFLPLYLFDDRVDSDFITSVVPTLMVGHNKVNDKAKWDIVFGLAKNNKILRGVWNDPEEEYTVRGFGTDAVRDVRVLFRKSTDEKERRTIGSKMRLYFEGSDPETGELEVQSIDSGFLTSPNAGDVFQNALASTNMYNALYSIGSKASVVKYVYQSDKLLPNGKKVTKKYRTIGMLRSGYRDFEDIKAIDHILTPAGWECGIDDPVDFFGKNLLDSLERIFFEARSLDQVEDMLVELPGADLTRDEAKEIIRMSNVPEANLTTNPNKDKDFTEGNAEGINIVITLDALANILESE